MTAIVNLFFPADRLRGERRMAQTGGGRVGDYLMSCNLSTWL